MKPLPLTPELREVAGRVVWFEGAEKALGDPLRFLAYAMRYATHEDMKVVRRHIPDEAFRAALDHIPPGIVDGRSWAYWNLVLGRRAPPPPPPRRLCGD